MIRSCVSQLSVVVTKYHLRGGEISVGSGSQRCQSRLAVASGSVTRQYIMAGIARQRQQLAPGARKPRETKEFPTFSPRMHLTVTLLPFTRTRLLKVC